MTSSDRDESRPTDPHRLGILKVRATMPTIGMMHELPSDRARPNTEALTRRSLLSRPDPSRPERATRFPTGSAVRWTTSRILVVLLAVSTALIGFFPGSPTADAAPGSFTISGKGWGHGVGMSQWGARGRAARGENFRQILAHYYTGTSVVPGTISNEVRVLAAEAVPTVTLTVSKNTTIGNVTVPAGQSVTVTRSGSSLEVSGAVRTTVGSPLLIPVGRAGNGNQVKVAAEGRATTTYEYGTVRVDSGSSSGLRVIIKSLSMQEYLYGLGEMPMSWPVEALKSQIVAARTFVQKQINARKNNPTYADYDVNASLDGAYTGTTHTTTSFFTNNWKPAVDATNGLVITYGGALIDANYSASSGGYTVNSETAFVTAVPYLRGVPDPDDLTGNNPHANWSATFTAAELGSWFGVGTMSSMTVTGAVPASKHLDKTDIRLVGTTGTKTVTGAQFRNTLNSKAGGSRLIRSTMFSIDGSPTSPGGTGAPGTPPPAPRYPTGAVTSARASGRTIIVEGTAKDPDGPVIVRVVSTMGREQAVRDYWADGMFRSTWNGAPGTRNVCVTVFDNPTLKGISLGCRDVVVK